MYLSILILLENLEDSITVSALPSHNHPIAAPGNLSNAFFGR